MNVLTIPVVSEPDILEESEIVHVTCQFLLASGKAFCGYVEKSPIIHDADAEPVCIVCDEMDRNHYCPKGKTAPCFCRGG